MIARALTNVVGSIGMSCLILGCSGGFDKMPESDVDASQKATAQRIGTKMWDGCKTGKHEPLGEDEAIKEMRDGLTPAKMAAACESARTQFGAYSGMDYAETWKPKSGSLRVYRFKGRFDKASTAPEIRVVMEGTKLSGLWIKPWSSDLR
jgi:hypothetical protein